jgi:hypothetical protein
MELTKVISNLFQSYLKYEENKYYGNVFLNKLLKYQIKKPNEQRILDKNKVNDIIKYQENYYNINNKFNFVGLIKTKNKNRSFSPRSFLLLKLINII